MVNSFPAVVIGGPPHSGKSVLAYLLTQQLRTWKVEHYVLRACPDGEGDWSQEASPETVRLLRQKGAFTPQFVDRVCADLARRHLPLLVDIGGKPTADQECILDVCTHAILLATDEADMARWRALAQRHGLAVMAELRSARTGEDAIFEGGAVLRGQIAALERHTASAGAVTMALAQRLRDLFTCDVGDLRRHHLDAAPTELAVDVEQVADWVDLTATQGRWHPQHLPAAIDYLPVAALSLHGRGPNWLYAALALHVAPHPFFLFDVRLGWTQPVSLILSASPRTRYLHWRSAVHPTFTQIELLPHASYLDYEELLDAELPTVDERHGVVLSGKLPNWLLVGAALAYRAHPWIGIVQAQQQDRAVIVYSRDPGTPVGECLSLDGG